MDDTDASDPTAPTTNSDADSNADTPDQDHDSHAAQFEEHLDRITDGFFAVDTEWRFTYLNERAEDLINPEGEDLIGKTLWDEFPDALESDFESKYRYAMENQVSVSFEEHYPEPLDTWFAVNAYPSETGLSVYFRDVTERKQREHDLEQYETLTETASDVVISIDTQSTIRDVNPAVADVFGYDPDEVIGEPLTMLMPDDLAAAHREGMRRYLETGEKALDWDFVEVPGETKSGQRLDLEVSFSEYTHDDELFFTGIIRDVTEQKHQQRQMETMHDRIADAFISLDPDATVQHVNDKAEDLLRLPKEHLLGECLWDPFPEEFIETFRDDFERAMETQEAMTLERYYPFLDRWYRGRIYPAETGASVYYHDITEQKRHEEHQERSEEAKRRLHEVSVSQAPLQEKLETVLGIGTDYFDLDYGFLADVDTEADPSDPCTFDVVAAHGFDADDGWTYPLDETYCQSVLAMEDVLWTTDAENADWVSEDVYNHFEFDTYIGSRVVTNGDPFGVVGFVSDDSRSHPFTAPEEAFIELVSQWIGYELQQAQQQAHLTTINECYEITRDIAHYILETDDRDAVEAEICDRLTSNDLPFEMAWIGDIRYDKNELVATYQAGDTDNYLEEVTIPLDQDTSKLETPSPALRAVRTHEPQVVSDTTTDDTIEPWREAMLKRDYRSAIAIPLTHNGLLYGLLAIYSPQPHAFDADICEILGHLGELIGHTVHSLEQDRALSEDASVFELQYWSDLRDVGTGSGLPVDGLTGAGESGTDDNRSGSEDRDPDVQATIERTVANGDEYRAFIRADGVVPEALIDMLTTLPTVTSATLIRCGGEDADDLEPDQAYHDCVFAAELTADSLVATIERYGARAKDLTFSSDGLSLTVEAPPTIDVKEFTDDIADIYPKTSLTSKKTVEREWLTPEELDQIIKGELTSRQRDVLQTAHLAGYFDRPRENSGEEVASILGISGATFSEHLRTAQHKLFDAIF